MFEATAGEDAEQVAPEFRLWRAVIARTVQEWLSGPLRRQREAEIYLLQDESDFPMVCSAAGLNPQSLRDRLSRMKRNGTVGADRALAHS